MTFEFRVSGFYRLRFQVRTCIFHPVDQLHGNLWKRKAVFSRKLCRRDNLAGSWEQLVTGHSQNWCLSSNSSQYQAAQRRGATGGVSQRGLLWYARRGSQRRACAFPTVQLGLVWRSGAVTGGSNRLVESTCREKTSGAAYEHIPKDKSAGGTQSNSDLVTLLRVSNCVSGVTLRVVQQGSGQELQDFWLSNSGLELEPFRLE